MFNYINHNYYINTRYSYSSNLHYENSRNNFGTTKMTLVIGARLSILLKESLQYFVCQTMLYSCQHSLVYIIKVTVRLGLTLVYLIISQKKLKIVKLDIVTKF